MKFLAGNTITEENYYAIVTFAKVSSWFASKRIFWYRKKLRFVNYEKYHVQMAIRYT